MNNKCDCLGAIDFKMYLNDDFRKRVNAIDRLDGFFLHCDYEEFMSIIDEFDDEPIFQEKLLDSYAHLVTD